MNQTPQNNPQVRQVEITLEEVLLGCTKSIAIDFQVVDKDIIETIEKPYLITINPGVEDGAKIEYAQTGDLLEQELLNVPFQICVLPHAHFKRLENDIVYQIVIDHQFDPDAPLQFTIPTLDGHSFNISTTMQEIMENDGKKTFQGLGLPNYQNPNERGDLIVLFEVKSCGPVAHFQNTYENYLETPKRSDINILLIGETGAGKSTTLNAIANYFKFNSFEEALTSPDGIIEVIPSNFTLPNPQTGDIIIIRSGPEDRNEQEGDGNSRTQSPTGYVFDFGNRILRIIDTPGIGDTGGMETDKQNFQQIMDYLKFLKHLNAIVFVLNGCDSRKTSFFKYCTSQLFSYLHSSVSANILFCFTNSRNSLYGPGDGFEVLKQYLKHDMRDTKIELKPLVNCFFIDNEAYRFFVAKGQGYCFLKGRENAFKESWDNSVKHIQMMFNRVIELSPHELENTISLNNSQKFITQMTEPMIKLLLNSKENLKRIHEFQKQLFDSTQNKNNIPDEICCETVSTKPKKLKPPITVCTVCTVKRNNGKQEQKICHPNCNCIFAKGNIKGEFALRFCFAMEIFSLSPRCRKCGCEWNQHKHLRYEYKEQIQQIIRKEKLNEMNNIRDKINQINQAINEAKTLEKELKEELNAIQEIAAKCACLLSAHSFLKIDYFKNQLNNLIEEEKSKPESNIDLLYKLKQDHESKVAFYKDSKLLRIEDIHSFQQKLLELKHTGENFRQMIKVINSLNDENVARRDRKVPNISSESQLYNMFRNSFMVTEF